MPGSAVAITILVVIVIIRASSLVPAPVVTNIRGSHFLTVKTGARNSSTTPHVRPVLALMLSGVNERQSEPAHEPNANEHYIAERVDKVDFEHRGVRLGPRVHGHEVERGPTAYLGAWFP